MNDCYVDCLVIFARKQLWYVTVNAAEEHDYRKSTSQAIAEGLKRNQDCNGKIRELPYRSGCPTDDTTQNLLCITPIWSAFRPTSTIATASGMPPRSTDH